MGFEDDMNDRMFLIVCLGKASVDDMQDDVADDRETDLQRSYAHNVWPARGRILHAH